MVFDTEYVCQALEKKVNTIELINLAINFIKKVLLCHPSALAGEKTRHSNWLKAAAVSSRVGLQIQAPP